MKKIDFSKFSQQIFFFYGPICSLDIIETRKNGPELWTSNKTYERLRHGVREHVAHPQKLAFLCKEQDLNVKNKIWKNFSVPEYQKWTLELTKILKKNDFLKNWNLKKIIFASYRNWKIKWRLVLWFLYILMFFGSKLAKTSPNPLFSIFRLLEHVFGKILP